MKKMIMRLRNTKGESLIESMAAILIFTMASIIMLTMVTASANINAEAKKADAAYQEQLLIAEKAERTATPGQVGITIIDTNGNETQVSVSVDVYASDEVGSLYAYYPANTEDPEVSGS